MGKRAIAGASWYVATLAVYELLIYVTGGPHEVGPILGLIAALFVAIDPLHRIWGTRASSGPPHPSFNAAEPQISSSRPI